MFLTRALNRNLNISHWNRRVWEIGYNGPPLPKQKATGRPDYPVSASRVALLRERFAREWGVMKLLARPYITAEMESAYFASKGVKGLDELREKEHAKLEAQRMPGKEKRTHGSKFAVRRRANIGNLLHTHRTVEDSLADLMNRNRWD
uniref:Transposase n=1 Tax=Angiostrongylus cantonensis TaxID=6313 RepID=A0A0K0CVB0_ANGCA